MCSLVYQMSNDVCEKVLRDFSHCWPFVQKLNARFRRQLSDLPRALVVTAENYSLMDSLSVTVSVCQALPGGSWD